MRKWMKVTAVSAFAAAGMFAFGSGAAQADTITSGDGSVLSGNQLVADVNAPVNVCGNAVGALVGVAGASCDGGQAVVDNSSEENHYTIHRHSKGKGHYHH